MKVDIIDTNGKNTGKKAELPDSIFGIEPNDHAIYLDVKRIRNSQRQGTHKTKERNEISRSKKKIKRQKGTGTARAGGANNPLFRGGGRIFGPKPRDYRFKLNKKVVALARKSALSYKAKEKNVIVISEVKFDEPKTQEMAFMLNNLGVAEGRTLVVTPDSNKNVVLSARNIPKSEVARAGDLNTYEIVKADKLIIEEGSLEVITKTLDN